jgi:hypothetical protein
VVLFVAIVTCERCRPVMAQGVVNRLAVRGLGTTAPVRSELLEACGRDGMSWLLVMSRRGCTYLLMPGSCVAMPGVVGVRRGPGVGTCALARGLASLQGLGEAETVSEGSGEAEPLPKGSSEVEPVRQGFGRGGALT